MSRCRNICITLMLSILLHISILYLYPFQISADVPERREVKVVFKINDPGPEKVQPVSKKIKTITARKPVEMRKIKKTPDKITKKTVIAKVAPAKVIEVKAVPAKAVERTEVAVKNDTIEGPVFTYTPPAPQPKKTDNHEAEGSMFKSMVLGKIEKEKVYPETARRMGIEGDVLVSFTILPDGTVDDIAVHASHKCHRMLKKAAVTTIERAAPYVPVPLSLRHDKGLRMEIKIAYKIT